MMIQIEREDVEELKKWGWGIHKILEQCVFCKQETRYWNKETNKPCCPNCALRFNQSDFKKVTK